MKLYGAIQYPALPKHVNLTASMTQFTGIRGEGYGHLTAIKFVCPHKMLNTNRKDAATADALTPEIRVAYLAKGKIHETCGPDIDYAMLIKLFGGDTGSSGHERK